MTQQPTFIGEYRTISKVACDEVIEHFLSKIEMTRYVPQDKLSISAEQKECWQYGFTNANIPSCHHRILAGLQEALEAYLQEFPYANKMDPFVLDMPYQLQYYEPGWAYHPFHFERGDARYTHRVLVWLIYLNDVTDAGETEFLYQNVKVRPEAGKVIIWPTDWTHTHRGVPSPTQDKFILTGWYIFK